MAIVIDDRLFSVRIKCFVCDRPAHSFVKCIIGHGGYFACERCEDPGKRVQNRTVYTEVNARRRTDASFRDQSNREHHHDSSPLLSIEPPINMVTQFSLDLMHLCCLRVMKKMIVDFWLRPKVTTRIGRNNKCRLSGLLKRLKYQIPEESQRTTRELNEIAKWKATEFRFFFTLCWSSRFEKNFASQFVPTFSSLARCL